MSQVLELRRQNQSNAKRNLEAIRTEKLIDQLKKGTEDLITLPDKYGRALISYLELRTLEITSLMGMSTSGAEVAHLQGRLKEASETLYLIRTILSEKEVL